MKKEIPEVLEVEKLVKLCHRCEYRARSLEGKGEPRYECGERGAARFSCYMYRPVSPVILRCQKGDKRPPGGPFFISARMEGVRVPECCEHMKPLPKKGEYAVWTIPFEVAEKSYIKR